MWRETAAFSTFCAVDNNFNPLPPCGGRQYCQYASLAQDNFNPLPPWGGRHFRFFFNFGCQLLNPLPPCGGRPQPTRESGKKQNFNPLPPCGGRQSSVLRAGVDKAISIHSLRVEGDLIIPQASTKVKHFNPLPPCGGRLSEHPSTFLAMYFNPLPPCGGRLYGPLHLWYNNSISIHSLRVEGDSGILADCLPPSISIHSLRVEGDVIRCMLDYVVDFNPLPPCGGRPSYQPAINHNLIFQSTPSVWRETNW